MKQSRIGLGVVTMLSIFVVVCMCVLVLFSSNKVYQIHEQTNRSYAFKKAYYEAEIKAHKLIDENQTDFLVHVKGDTYLYKSGTSLMELCVVKDMEPDLTMGQPLMTCHDFDVEQDTITISCKINGVTFYVNIRSEVAS